MKKGYLILIIIITIFLSACSTKNSTVDNKTSPVDKINQTVTIGEKIYKYNIEGSQITITYPDNSSYWWVEEESGGHGGWSEDYDESKYMPGPSLISLINAEAPRKTTNKNYSLILLLFIVGIWNAVFPYYSWYLSYGWRYKNVEPSDIAINFTRISGISMILISIFVFIII